MNEPLLKLVVRPVTCFVVQAYRPHRTKKGHFVWRYSHDVMPVLEYDALMPMAAQLRERLPDQYKHLPTGSIHNHKLTIDEEIKALGQEQS